MNTVYRSPEDLHEIYDLMHEMDFPYRYDSLYEAWEESYARDADGAGRALFAESETLAAYAAGKPVGFIQYGRTAFGFDSAGEISEKISYPVIRNFFFLPGWRKAGAELLERAMEKLARRRERIWAFYHYFGMSCYARHGKLFEGLSEVRELLLENGFAVEHENVFYSSRLAEWEATGAEIRWQDPTPGGQQRGELFLRGEIVGDCEVHILKQGEIAYLRWIGIDPKMRRKGVGSQAMAALRNDLLERGIRRLDTDTALTNERAQRYYQRNRFIREGLTRSYFADAQ